MLSQSKIQVNVDSKNQQQIYITSDYTESDMFQYDRQLQSVMQPTKCCRKKIIIIFVIIFFISSSVTIGLGLYFGGVFNKKQNIQPPSNNPNNPTNSPNNTPTNTPNNTPTNPPNNTPTNPSTPPPTNSQPLYNCSNNQLCNSVNVQVRDSIVYRHSEPQIVQALISYSSSLLQFQNVSQQNYQQMSKKSFRNAQCSRYKLGDQAFEEESLNLKFLTLDTQERVKNYYKMAYSIQQGQITPRSQSQLQAQCNSSDRRRILQVGQNNNCGQVQSVLHFIGGEGYSAQKAQKVIKIIRRLAVIDPQITFGRYSFQGINRQNSNSIVGFAWDLAVSIRQKFLSEAANSTILDNFIQIMELINDPNRVQSSSTVGQNKRMISRVSDAMKQVIDQFGIFFHQKVQQSSQVNVDLNKNIIQQHISQGKKVIVVAHSVGSLYANKIYNALSSNAKQYIAFVYLAPLVNQMPSTSSPSGNDQQRYIQNPLDEIYLHIKSVSQSGHGSVPLLARTQGIHIDQAIQFINTNNQLGFLNHNVFGYISKYRTRVITYLKAAKQIQNPSNQNSLGNGPITVQLTWDQKPDVDMHIFQPDGTHIYYSNKIGNVGHLDYDDVTGYGPQHYFTQCENLTEGTYKISLNYFSGSGTTHTNVKVKAGYQWFEKNTSLNPSIGSRGNSNPPYKICKINVRKNPNGSFSFEIVDWNE